MTMGIYIDEWKWVCVMPIFWILRQTEFFLYYIAENPMWSKFVWIPAKSLDSYGPHLNVWQIAWKYGKRSCFVIQNAGVNKSQHLNKQDEWAVRYHWYEAKLV